jgi:hypothetical protein
VPDDPDVSDRRRLVVRNEFGVAAVELLGEPGRERLRIEDVRSGVSIELDALELESLAWAQHTELRPLLDPSLTRWQDEDQAHPPADQDA